MASKPMSTPYDPEGRRMKKPITKCYCPLSMCLRMRTHRPFFSFNNLQVRTAFKGQIFSAPMDWSGMVQQLENMEHNEAYRCVPMSGEARAAHVQIKPATVGRHVVVQLIRMWRDAGHPDYKDAFRGEAFHRQLHSCTPDYRGNCRNNVMCKIDSLYVS